MIVQIGFVLACWLMADFMSGCLHWAEDRYFRADWPVIGKYVAVPNELHHTQQRAFLAGNYWTRNWTTILPAALCCAIAFPSPWCLTFVFVSQANEVHAWAHQKCSRWIRMLQEIGLLQSASHHSRHHKSPFRVRYCAMSNWLNPILDEIRFWDGVEWCLARVGIHPKPDPEEEPQVATRRAA